MAAFAYSPSGDGMAASSFGFASLTSELRAGPVVCGTCGCRLEERAEPDGSTAWFHFGAAHGRDARGCAIECSSVPHDAAGDALSPF